MADADTIITRAQGIDATLAAASSFPFWVDRAIETHYKPNWLGFTGVQGYDVYFTAMACWALHKSVMAAREVGGKIAPAGPVQSKRTGDVSVTYAISATPNAVLSVDEDFALTTWGRLYLGYRGKLAQGVTGTY